MTIEELRKELDKKLGEYLFKLRDLERRRADKDPEGMSDVITKVCNLVMLSLVEATGQQNKGDEKTAKEILQAAISGLDRMIADIDELGPLLLEVEAMADEVNRELGLKN